MSLALKTFNFTNGLKVCVNGVLSVYFAVRHTQKEL